MDKLWLMRRVPKQKASEGFIKLLRDGMDKRKISLNQLAEQASMSPAFLSRIMNKQRGLPTGKAILRLAEVLDLQPRERLLIEAGRIPEELKPGLSELRAPELLRSFGKLNEADKLFILNQVKALELKHRGKKKS